MAPQAAPLIEDWNARFSILARLSPETGYVFADCSVSPKDCLADGAGHTFPGQSHRKNFLFLGSGTGGERAAILYTVLEAAKPNGLDPEAWLADVIDRLARGHPIHRLGELLPWNGQRQLARMAA